MITVWDTEHGNSTIITPCIYKGILATGERAVLRKTSDYYGRIVPSVFYGILRGNAPIIKQCAKAAVEWWFIDNGFFRAGHFGGYYQIGKNQLQPRFSNSAPVEPKRWANLGIRIEPWRSSKPGSHVLICPPTAATADFYQVNKASWTANVLKNLSLAVPGRPLRVREKGTSTPLVKDFADCHCVVTYNSKVAIQALVLGIPAIADRGIVKDWNGLSAANAGGCLTSHDRLALFRFAASCQFRLDEFSTGGGWKAIRRILT